MAMGTVHVEVGMIFVHLTCACAALSKILAVCIPLPPSASSVSSSVAMPWGGGQVPMPVVCHELWQGDAT